MTYRMTRKWTKTWTLNDGRTVAGCRDLACYSATLGPFCVTCSETYKPVANAEESAR